jgi:hypothetical protein
MEDNIPELKDDSPKYVAADRKAMLVYVMFFLLWIGVVAVSLNMAETEIAGVKAMAEKDFSAAAEAMDEISLNYLILPICGFIAAQGLYCLWLGIRTAMAGVYPPPGSRMPFRTRIQSGWMARLSASGLIIAGLCNLAVIILLVFMRHEIISFFQAAAGRIGG